MQLLFPLFFFFFFKCWKAKFIWSWCGHEGSSHPMLASSLIIVNTRLILLYVLLNFISTYICTCKIIDLYYKMVLTHCVVIQRRSLFFYYYLLLSLFFFLGVCGHKKSLHWKRSSSFIWIKNGKFSRNYICIWRDSQSFLQYSNIVQAITNRQASQAYKKMKEGSLCWFPKFQLRMEYTHSN